MYLYDNNGKNIDIYSLNSDNNKTKKYRTIKMKEIKEDERFFYTNEMSTRNIEPMPFLFKKLKDTNVIRENELMERDWRLIKYDKPLNLEGKKLFERISLICNRGRTNESTIELINNYYNGKYTNEPVIKVSYLENGNIFIKYLLFTTSEYNCYTNPHDPSPYFVEVDNIISIPKELFFLQLIQLEKFMLATSEDISEQLELFNFKFIDSFNKDELQKMDKYGITENNYSRIITKANNDSHILRLLKK